MAWNLTIANEGTADEQVELIVTPVQLLSDNGALDPTQDEWEKILSDLGPFSLTASGGAADSTEVQVTLRDNDADLGAFNGPRYALPGVYTVDVMAFYRMNPTVAHTIRLEVEVLRDAKPQARTVQTELNKVVTMHLMRSCGKGKKQLRKNGTEKLYRQAVADIHAEIQKLKNIVPAQATPAWYAAKGQQMKYLDDKLVAAKKKLKQSVIHLKMLETWNS